MQPLQKGIITQGQNQSLHEMFLRRLLLQELSESGLAETQEVVMQTQ
jgi:hypothetical protein